MRSGSHALTLLSVPLSGRILDQLADGPERLARLHDERDSAPQSTVRARLKGMQGDGLVMKHARRGTPGVADFALTEAGDDLLVVVTALEHWLALAPSGPLAYDSAAGKAAIRALVGGWSSTMLGGLAVGPLSLSELADGIGGIAYPSLSRRLMAMRRAGQVHAVPGKSQGDSFEVTEWLQQAVAPLAAAVRWERTYCADGTAAMTRLDTEAAFLLALPLLRMGRGPGGSCRLGVEIDDEEGRLCGAVAVVKRGGRVTGSAGCQGPAASWAEGTVLAWAQAMLGAGTDDLEIGGTAQLAHDLLESLQQVLLGDAGARS